MDPPRFLHEIFAFGGVMLNTRGMSNVEYLLTGVIRLGHCVGGNSYRLS